MSLKPMTFRTDDAQIAALEKVAAVDGVPVSEAVRRAIDSHIESRRQDAEFQQRLQEIIERDREILERLASI